MLRISVDAGRTWPKQYTIDKSQGLEKGDHAAYSDLATLDKRTLGILYERNNYREITFVRQRWRP
jgi:sialidase-1